MKIVQIDDLMAKHNQVNFTDEPTVEQEGVLPRGDQRPQGARSIHPDLRDGEGNRAG